jgi:hypothetical protein
MGKASGSSLLIHGNAASGSLGAKESHNGTFVGPETQVTNKQSCVLVTLRSASSSSSGRCASSLVLVGRELNLHGPTFKVGAIFGLHGLLGILGAPEANKGDTLALSGVPIGDKLALLDVTMAIEVAAEGVLSHAEGKASNEELSLVIFGDIAVLAIASLGLFTAGRVLGNWLLAFSGLGFNWGIRLIAVVSAGGVDGGFLGRDVVRVLIGAGSLLFLGDGLGLVCFLGFARGSLAAIGSV